MARPLKIALASCALCALSSVAGQPQTALAQPKTIKPFAYTFKQLSKRQPPTLQFAQDPKTNAKQLIIQSGGRKPTPLSVVNVPSWLSAKDYKYDVTVKRHDNKRLFVLFEALPRFNDVSVGGSTTFQLAWMVTQQPGLDRWTFIARATFSDLDGGQVLELRQEKKRWQLYRQRPLPTMRFCGKLSDKSMDLERFAPNQSNFVLQQDINALTKGAKALQAYLPTKKFKNPLLSNYYLWRAATSDRRNPANTAQTVIRPLALGDRAIESSWGEGASDLGRGEFVTARLDDTIPLRGMRLFPGQGKSAEDFTNHARPTQILLGLSDGSRFIIDLPELSFAELNKREGVVIELPNPIKTSCMSIMLLKAKRSTVPVPKITRNNKLQVRTATQARHTVSISEITPFSVVYGLKDSEAAPLLLKLFLEEKNPKRRQRLAYTARPFGSAMVQETRRLLKEGKLNAKKQAQLMVLLGIMPPVDAVPLLVELFEKTEIRSPSYRPLKLAIYAHQQYATEDLFKVLKNMGPKDVRKSTDLIRLLGRIATGSQLEQLIPSMGKGSVLVRNERIRAIAGGGVNVVEPLVKVAVASVDTLKGYDALKALSTIARRLLNPQKVLTDEQAKAMIALARQSRRRRFKMRAYQVLGRFKANGADLYFKDIVLPKAKDTLLRRAAVMALADIKNKNARLALEEALFDASPDVRIQAIRGLFDHPNREASIPKVQVYVSRERWKMGLEPALTFLATMNKPKLQQQIEGYIINLKQPDRALIAARALKRARRGMSGKNAQKIIFHLNTSYPLRRQVLQLLGQDRSKEGRTVLLKTINNKPFAALETPRRVEELRKTAMLALGQRQAAQDVDLLLERAAKEPNLKLQLAALRALAFYRDASVIKKLDRFKANAPAFLHNAIESSKTSIQRRLDLQEVQKELEKK